MVVSRACACTHKRDIFAHAARLAPAVRFAPSAGSPLRLPSRKNVGAAGSAAPAPRRRRRAPVSGGSLCRPSCRAGRVSGGPRARPPGYKARPLPRGSRSPVGPRWAGPQVAGACRPRTPRFAAPPARPSGSRPCQPRSRSRRLRSAIASRPSFRHARSPGYGFSLCLVRFCGGRSLPRSPSPAPASPGLCFFSYLCRMSCHTSRLLRAIACSEITRRYYEPGRLDRCYRAIWREHIVPRFGISYKTYLRYLSTPYRRPACDVSSS